MITVFSNISSIITSDTQGRNFKAGNEMNDIGIIRNSRIVVENGIIKDIVPNGSSIQNFDTEIDLSGKIILPGFIECHTHTAFAGSRAEEFRQKLSGTDYETIAQKGGGIITTVKSVRESSFEDLIQIIKPRIAHFISQGITSLEIKSGYGLSFYDEIKLLQVIRELNKIAQIDIIPTFLGAHTLPPEYKNEPGKYIEIITNELLPFISKNKLAVFCDAFCENTAFSAADIDNIFERSSELGLKLKLHTEQFNSIGGIETALKFNVTSADHLEVINDLDIERISKAGIPAVLLPGVSFFLNHKFAPARKLIDAGAVVAISTDYNPGSSNISSLPLVMSIAALKMQMSVEEVISAVTINAAKALDISHEAGSIEIGKKADFAVFNTDNYTDIIYNIGQNLNYMTVKSGNVIYQNPAIC